MGNEVSTVTDSIQVGCGAVATAATLGQCKETIQFTEKKAGDTWDSAKQSVMVQASLSASGRIAQVATLGQVDEVNKYAQDRQDDLVKNAENFAEGLLSIFNKDFEDEDCFVIPTVYFGDSKICKALSCVFYLENMCFVKIRGELISELPKLMGKILGLIDSKAPIQNANEALNDLSRHFEAIVLIQKDFCTRQNLRKIQYARINADAQHKQQQDQIPKEDFSRALENLNSSINGQEKFFNGIKHLQEESVVAQAELTDVQENVECNRLNRVKGRINSCNDCVANILDKLKKSTDSSSRAIIMQGLQESGMKTDLPDVSNHLAEELAKSLQEKCQNVYLLVDNIRKQCACSQIQVLNEQELYNILPNDNTVLT